MPYPRNQKSKQQGVVVVLALFIVALLAAMSYSMLSRLMRDTTRTRLIIENTQADLYAEGALAWAAAQLKQNGQSKQEHAVVDATPIIMPVHEEGGYTITCTIEDMQARFNLNQVTTESEESALAHLLLAISSDMADDQAMTLAGAVRAWVSMHEDDARGDAYYHGLNPPYRAHHHPMASRTELQLVQGISPRLYELLLPYVTALPRGTPVNIMHAPVPVLMTLHPEVTAGVAQDISSLRERGGFDSVASFIRTDLAKKIHISRDKMTDTSQYFLVMTDVVLASNHMLQYTLLKREVKAKRATIEVVWQSKGAW